MLRSKKQPFFGNQYPINTNTKQASIHAKVQFQYTKSLSQIFSVMSINKQQQTSMQKTNKAATI